MTSQGSSSKQNEDEKDSKLSNTLSMGDSESRSPIIRMLARHFSRVEKLKLLTRARQQFQCHVSSNIDVNVEE
jgi:hypothetical protein